MCVWESLRKQTWRPPQPAQDAALPAPNFKKGRCLFKFTHTHTAHPPHTPPAKTEVVMAGSGGREKKGEARLFVGLPRQPSPGLRAPHW